MEKANGYMDLLIRKVEERTSWGKEQLKVLMKDTMIEFMLTQTKKPYVEEIKERV